MPRIKGTGKKAKLSVSVDQTIVDKLNQNFKDSRKKSLFVNEILIDNLDAYLAAYQNFIMVDESSEFDKSVLSEYHSGIIHKVTEYSPTETPLQKMFEDAKRAEVTFEVSAARKEVQESGRSK